jgi:hypothetical protein
MQFLDDFSQSTGFEVVGFCYGVFGAVTEEVFFGGVAVEIEVEFDTLGGRFF